MLTPRQLSVLELVAEGMGWKEIGKRLNIARPTVAQAMRQTCERLETVNRAPAAVAEAFRRGMLK